MLNKDEDALICDLAETYGIFDYKSLPVQLVATLSIGLRGDSRIKMILSGSVLTRSELIMSLIADNTALNLWAKTKDGKYGRHKPKPLRDVFADAFKEKDIIGFETPEEYELARQEILKEVTHGGH